MAKFNKKKNEEIYYTQSKDISTPYLTNGECNELQHLGPT